MLEVLVNWPAHPEEKDLIAAVWPREWAVVYSADHSKADILAMAGRFDAIAGQLTPELLAAATNLKFMHVLGHGIDRLGEGALAAALAARAIPIARANPAAITISEFVMMSLIALNRRLISVHENLAYRGEWSEKRLADRMKGGHGGEIYGRTLCVAGLGEIGRAIAARAKAFGMVVGGLTRNPGAYAPDALGIDFLGSLATPEECLSRSDHLVIALPLTPDTENFLSVERLAAMPRGSYLVNIGRAAMVDQDAMVTALETGDLAGAAIDVWPDESARTYPHPRAIHHHNVIMTPHSCAITRESRVRAIEAVGENMRRHQAGETLRNAAPLTL